MGGQCSCGKRNSISQHCPAKPKSEPWHPLLSAETNASNIESVNPVLPMFVNTFANVPSLSSPSPLTSVVSESLDDLGDFNIIWDQLVNSLLHPPWTTKTKHIEIKPRREHEFFIVHHYDGEKFQILQDIELVTRWRISRGQALLFGEVFDAGRQVVHTVWLLLHENPLRAEMWGQTNEFLRTSGAFEQGLLQMVLDLAVYRLKDQVKVKSDVDSPSFSGMKSIVSAPLDEVFTSDQLWDAYMALLTSPPQDGIVKSFNIENPKDNGFSIRHVIDGYSLKRGNMVYKNSTGDDIELLTAYVIDKESWTVSSEDYNPDGMLKLKRCWKILENPLRVEFWGEASDGERLASGPLMVELQRVLARLVWDTHGFKKVQAPLWADGPASSSQPVSPTQVICETPSPTEPGCNSVLSAAIPMAPGELYEKLIKVCKNPPRSATLRSSSLKSSSHDGFTTECTKAPFQQVFKTEEVYTIARDNLSLISTETLLNENGSRQLFMKRYILILESPTRVECWGEGGDGLRKAGDFVRRIIDAYLAAILGQPGIDPMPAPQIPVMVKVHADVPAPKAPWLKSIFSDPCDMHTSFDDFWELMIDMLREPEKWNPFVTSKEDLTCTGTSIEHVLTLGGSIKVHLKKSWDKEMGEVNTERFTLDNGPKENIYIKLHRSPLRLQGWAKTELGERKHGEALRMEAELLVNTIIKKLKARQ